MSFRDNLQHLRATRNMTQEQLAMLLGVSRQSVSKWEAERAYPEMDKLLRLCALFECTLDELVCGDLTERPAAPAQSLPVSQPPQDVTGYDEAMRAFAWKVPLGVAVVMLGFALSMLLSGLTLMPGSAYQSYSSVLMLVGAVAGLAVILPAWFERNGFRTAHPFVEDFYTVEQKAEARRALSTGLVVGIGLIVAGLAATIVLPAAPWLSSSICLLLATGGVFAIVRGRLLAARCDVAAYNRRSLRGMDEAQIDALDDENLAERARRAKSDHRLCVAIMCVATAVALVLLFVPALGGQWWFWLTWPIGGLACVAVKAIRSGRAL